jgi:hypothetical protein
MQLNPLIFDLPPNEKKLYGKQNLTYGSLTNKGLQNMVLIIKKYINNNIYGFDLGCGDGELIYHLEKSISGSRWEGVEISEHRISIQQRDVCIWQGDMLNENFKNYNVIHADNLCLEDYIAEKLEEKISNEFKGIYISYRTPTNYKFLKNAILLDSILTETTWNDHIIHYYRIL